MCYALKDSSLDLIYTDYLDLLFKDSDKGFISLFKKNKSSVYQRHYKKELLNEAIEEYLSNDWNLDLYMSLNTFITPKRTLESLRYLNALFIDIDCYKMNMSKESVLYFIENDLYGTDIPIPTFIIDSGRGLYLVWLIDRVPSKAYPLWKALEHKFYNALKEFGADPKALDPTRVLRVPGSINSKSLTKVEILEYNPYRYTLQQLKEDYLPIIEKKVKEKKKQKRTIVNIYNSFTLHSARIKDLETLAELRNYSLEGTRELFLFLYRYYNELVSDKETALEKAIEMNNMFSKPLRISEVVGSTKTNYLGKYNYTNEKLVEVLDISEEEMKHMTTIISKAEKYKKNNERRKKERRNEKGLTKREEAKREKLINILKLDKLGKETHEIAKELNISTRTVRLYKKELNENAQLREELEKNFLKSKKLRKSIMKTK